MNAEISRVPLRGVNQTHKASLSGSVRFTSLFYDKSVKLHNDDYAWFSHA